MLLSFTTGRVNFCSPDEDGSVIVIHYRASQLQQSDEDGSVIVIHYRASEFQQRTDEDGSVYCHSLQGE